MNVRLWWILLAGTTLLIGCAGRQETGSATGSETDKIVLRANVDPIGKNFRMVRELADDFETSTGVHIELIKGPTDATERLAQYFQYLGAQSSDIDIYQVDVIWPGALAEHLIDLKQDFARELDQFFAPIVENNTVEGRLVAIPWFGDAGMLYFRTDLLKKYGFAQPPSTWDELDSMATTIQQGEREAGKADFWGYVWQGKAYEGLTCNAIEWQTSHGGGRIVDAGRKVTVNTPATVAALKRAVSWIGRISPPGVTTYQEEEARQIFQQGNAAFMRNWPYAYALGMAGESAISGKFDVTVLPRGDGGNAAALGGWQLAVSKYSKHPREAVEFVKILVSREAQKQRAIKAAMLSTLPELYDDPDIAAAVPFFPKMKEIFLSATPRPSTVCGELYNEVSAAYFQNVHKALIGQLSPEQAVAEIEKTIGNILK